MGWTYRQILETVAFKPHSAPHLWEDRISQLAAELGMPRGTTQEEIVTFVIQVAKAKGELDRVAPLIRALAGASRLVHGHAVVPTDLRPLDRELHPDAARMLGFLDCAGEHGLNTAVQGHADEVSRRVCSSYSSTRILIVPRIRPHLRPARSNCDHILRLTRTRPMKGKRTKASPHVNEGSPRRTCTAASAPASSPSKTHTCA